MIINRENYEAFLLDLMEGNLSDVQENILRHFLEENPDLTIEDDLTEIRLPDKGEVPVSGISYPLKEELKKGGMNSEINTGNYEQFCISRLEGDLSAQSESRLDKFLAENPGLGKSAKTFGLTILKADKSVVFPEKNALRKGTAAIVTLKDYINKRFIYRTVSIAASVAIVISVFNFLSDNFDADQTFNPDNRNISITDDQSTASLPDPVPVLDTSPERSAVETAVDAGRELRETVRQGTSVPMPLVTEGKLLVTEEKKPFNSKHFASREPVLMPAKNISPVEVKAKRTDFSPEFVMPVQIAVNNREQQNTLRSGAGMILNGLLSFATRNVDSIEDGGGINIWDIADAGFRGINSITGAELRLEREFNQEGELVSMAFSSKVLEFRRTSSAKEN